MSDDELFAILSEIADEEIMAQNRSSIIEVGRRIISLAANGAEPEAWESTTPVYRRFITDSRYQKLSQQARKWYKPYRCPHCSTDAPQPAQTESDQVLREQLMARVDHIDSQGYVHWRKDGQE